MPVLTFGDCCWSVCLCAFVCCLYVCEYVSLCVCMYVPVSLLYVCLFQLHYLSCIAWYSANIFCLFWFYDVKHSLIKFCRDQQCMKCWVKYVKLLILHQCLTMSWKKTLPWTSFVRLHFKDFCRPSYGFSHVKLPQVVDCKVPKLVHLPTCQSCSLPLY